MSYTATSKVEVSDLLSLKTARSEESPATPYESILLDLKYLESRLCMDNSTLSEALSIL
jgi:hypothetical protein